MAQYKLSAVARQDLRDIWSYIAEHNRQAADRQIDRLIEKIGFLAEMPKAGRERVGFRSFVAGNYNIFYRTAGDVVEILRVLHGRRDCATLMSGTPDDD